MIEQRATRRHVLAMGVATTLTAADATMPATTTEHWAEVGGAALYVRDTGEPDRPAVVLAHPVTGSALVWANQERSYAAAGYRVIAWSRRDHARSRTTVPDLNPDHTADLLKIVDFLRLARFHALGSAAGGWVMLEFAVAHPARVRSLVVANNVGNIADPAYRARSETLRPPPFAQMSAAFRELGPQYRAADPAGVERWKALEKDSRTAPLGPQPSATMQWADLRRLTMPVLWITGDADFYAPPALFGEHRKWATTSEFATVGGAGHSAYWERPDLFDARVLRFMRERG